MTNLYIIFKIIHVISIITWMAGMFYLPRLFVYHVNANQETAKTFVVMEKKLLKIIMNPSMIIVWISGIYLTIAGEFYKSGWLHSKLLLVLIMSGIHGMLSAHRKKFENLSNIKSDKFFRILNEVPTILLILIIILVIAKPF